MTVAELITKLAQMPQDALITRFTGPIDNVRDSGYASDVNLIQTHSGPLLVNISWHEKTEDQS